MLEMHSNGIVIIFIMFKASLFVVNFPPPPPLSLLSPLLERKNTEEKYLN
jgi:hypothetical protein